MSTFYHENWDVVLFDNPIGKPKEKPIEKIKDFVKTGPTSKPIFKIKKGPLVHLRGWKGTLSGMHIRVPTFLLNTPPPPPRKQAHSQDQII